MPESSRWKAILSCGTLGSQFVRLMPSCILILSYLALPVTKVNSAPEARGFPCITIERGSQSPHTNLKCSSTWQLFYGSIGLVSPHFSQHGLLCSRASVSLDIRGLVVSPPSRMR